MVDENFNKNLKHQCCEFRFQVKELKSHYWRCPQQKGVKAISRILLCRECRDFIEEKN